MTLDEADKKVHAVKTQWHYPILTKYGFEPLDKEKQGLVRRYRYQKGNDIITCNTGVNADYWSGAGGGGYWSELEPYLKKQYGKEAP